MVQVIQRRDIGEEIGRSFGGGLSNIAQLGIQRQLQQRGIDELQGTIREKYMQPKTYLEGENKGENILDAQGNIQYEMKPGVDPVLMGLELLRGTAGQPTLQQALAENVLPLMMKRMQSGAAVDTAYGQGETGTGPNSAGPNVNVITQENLPAKVNELLVSAEKQRGDIDQVDDKLKAFIPQFDSQRPAWEVPNRQEISTMAREMRDAGAKAQEIYDAVNQRIQLAQNQYQSKMSGWKQGLEEFGAARGLEQEQREFLSGPDQSGGRIGAWLEDNQIPNTQFYHDVGYDLFSKVRQQQRNATDQQIWTKTKEQLENLKNLENQANDPNEGVAKPWIFPWKPIGGKKAQDAIQSGRDYAKQVYDIGGKNPTTIDRVRTNLVKNGWDNDLASYMAQPPSEGLEKWFDSIPVLTPETQAMSPNQAAQIEKKRKQQYDAIEVPQNIDKYDSIPLLRNRLVREKNMTKFQANDLIRKMKDQELLSQMQVTEMAELTESTPMLPLWNLFKLGVE